MFKILIKEFFKQKHHEILQMGIYYSNDVLSPIYTLLEFLLELI